MIKIQVELQEASPRLGRVMGVGQEPEEEVDHHDHNHYDQDQDHNHNDDHDLDANHCQARTELKPELAKPQTDLSLAAAGEPWQVVSSKASNLLNTAAFAHPSLLLLLPSPLIPISTTSLTVVTSLAHLALL